MPSRDSLRRLSRHPAARTGAVRYQSDAGPLGLDGTGDWAGFLRAGSTEQVARAVASMTGRGMTAVLSGDAPNRRIPAAEWEMVAPPALSEEEDGTLRVDGVAG